MKNNPTLCFVFFVTIALFAGISPANAKGGRSGERCGWELGAGLVRASFCPFCTAIDATFAEKINKHDISVIAKLVEQPPELEEPAEEFPKAKFEIVQILKGQELVAAGMTFETLLVGKYSLGEKFLVMGVEPPDVVWSTPAQASDRLIQYLNDTQTLPPSGPDRLAFFQDYLEDPEPAIAFDAYDEFAIADYADLIALKDRMHRDRLIKWIKDLTTRAERRRLYLTMLGVCGNAEDIKMLEGFLVSDDPQQRIGLDALAAAYLTLKGESGIPLLEEHFLTNFSEDDDTSDINAVVSALRFHGTEVDQIPKPRIAQAVRLLLKHPTLADTVIPDLARWEDWSVMEELVELFKNCDEDYQYVRVPVVAYLHSCPKPEAKEYLKELEKIDPDAIRRAKFFSGELMDEEFADNEGDEEAAESDDPNPMPVDDENSEDGESETEAEADSADDSPSDGSDDRIQPTTLEDLIHVSTLATPADESTATRSGQASLEMTSVPMPVSSAKTETSSTALSAATPPRATQPASDLTATGELPAAVVSTRGIAWLIIFVPLGFSLAIFLLLWSVVNGWFERLIF